MSTVPENVVEHTHVWPSKEAMEADRGRYDVCLLADGTTVIWCRDKGSTYGLAPEKTFSDACLVAGYMAVTNGIWSSIDDAIMQLRARDGDANESADDVAEWQEHILSKLGDAVRKAGHPSPEKLAQAGIRNEPCVVGRRT